MLEGTESGCAVHPTVPAVGSCKQCAKHYCNTCIVSTPFGRFCSEECRDQYRDFVTIAEANEANRKKKRSFLIGPKIRKLVILLLVIAFAGFVASVIEIPVLSGFVRSIRANFGI